ncbi:MAG: helix-turn-helix transcriptional regulator [Dehalococcoidia bacterium]
MELTTVSYAILGHLAMRPWSTYELATEMRRNITYFFPRAESRIYAEPKRLVALGLASATTETTGRRARTVYSITDDGRAELTRWLAAPPSRGPVLEFEGLLRVMLAPLGSDEDLAATLAQVRQDIRGLIETAAGIRQEYLEGRAPFQRAIAYRSMVYDFLTSFAYLVDDWAERSQARLADWPRQRPEERTAAALAVFEAIPDGVRQIG